MCCLFLSCGGGTTAEAPALTLAKSRVAQEAFRPLREQWLQSDWSARAKLEPRLLAYVDALPRDPTSRVAQAYAAAIALKRGDLTHAGERADQAAKGGAGATRDLAQVIHGGMLRRLGDPEGALEKLIPLLGKLIDPSARDLCQEELVASALAAGRWDEAVSFLDLALRWSETSEEEAGRARTRVDETLNSIPVQALEVMLDRIRKSGELGGYSAEMRKVLGGRLAKVALERSDPELARRLLEAGGGIALWGKAGEELSDLAASGGQPKVSGLSVGLLLSSSSRETRRRGAEVLSGLVDGLGLLQTVSKGRPRLLVREEADPRLFPVALSSLLGDGAALLIVAVEDSGVTGIIDFGSHVHIAVMMLSQPKVLSSAAAEPLPPEIFVLGASERAAAEALLGALRDEGAKGASVVGGTPETDDGVIPIHLRTACDGDPPPAGKGRFPVNEWRERGGAVAVLGDATCADDVLTEMGSSWTGKVGLGLWGAEAALSPHPAPLLVAQAGLFVPDAGEKSLQRGWIARHGSRLSFRAALGHDAGVLAHEALQGLPDSSTEDSAEIAVRYADTASRLRDARGTLWTTSASGFGGGQVMERAIVLRADPPRAARRDALFRTDAPPVSSREVAPRAR